LSEVGGVSGHLEEGGLGGGAAVDGCVLAAVELVDHAVALHERDEVPVDLGGGGRQVVNLPISLSLKR
jgi:hypothetical protein